MRSLCRAVERVLTRCIAKLRELWVIPIFFVIVTVVSMVVAYVLGLIFRLKRSQRCALPSPTSLFRILPPIVSLTAC